MHVILTHEQADFDALGALLGASILNPNAFPVIPRKLNRNARNFYNLYATELPFIHPGDIPHDPISFLTMVDTQALITLRGVTNQTQIEVFDHHHKRPEINPNWQVHVDRLGATTTIFVEKIREAGGVKLDVIPATLMLLGIYEDTGSLTYTNTRGRDAQAVAFLLDNGANLRIATQYLNPPLSPEQQILFDRLITTVETRKIHGQTVVIAKICAETMHDEVSSIAHKMRDMLEPDALFLVIQTPEGIRIVARSTTDLINVAAITTLFGGGGHDRAASALISDEDMAHDLSETERLQFVTDRLISLLSENIKPAIRVQEIMSQRPMLFKSNTLAEEAAEIMQRYGFEGYPVIKNDRVIGLLTRRAVDRALSHKLNLPAISLMEAGEVFVHPDDSIEELQRVMINSDWGQIPVVDQETNKVVGIVTRTDLIKTFSINKGSAVRKTNLSEKLNRSIPDTRLELLKIIAQIAHHQDQAVFIVGGFVRDLILDRSSQDFDLVVEGNAILLAKSLQREFGGKIIGHTRFGTAKWWLDENREKILAQYPPGRSYKEDDFPHSIDLISARTEYYDYPSALPVIECSNIKRDLQRRDFTMNTLAIRLDEPHYGELYDFWDGLSDIHERIVRVLHSLSFVDDPTRIIRAVRFEQRFDFQIELRTLEMLLEGRHHLTQVSGDRLRHEIDLILSEENPSLCLDRMNELGVLAAIYPGLRWEADWKEDFSKIQTAREELPWEIEKDDVHMPVLVRLRYLAWFYHLSQEDLPKIIDRLRIGSPFKKDLFEMLHIKAEINHLSDKKPSQVAGLLNGASGAVLYICYLYCSDETSREKIFQYVHHWKKVKSTITGENLKQMGIPPGPAYRSILDELRNAWLDGKVTDEESEKKFLQYLINGIK